MKPDLSERAHIEEELQVIESGDADGSEEVIEMNPARVFTFDEKTFRKAQGTDVDDVHVCRRIRRSKGFGNFEPPHR